MTLIDACGYIRMSTLSLNQKDSPGLQKEAIEALAEREGYRIVKWYYDLGMSGSRNQHLRVGWKELLTDAPTAEWKVVLIYSRSRFSRLDSIEEGFAKQILREAGKTLHSALDGKADWKTSTGRIVDTIRTEENAEFCRKLGHAILAGKIRGYKAGRPFGRPCPYGMARLVVAPDGHKTVILRRMRFGLPKDWSQKLVPGDEKEVEAVRFLFTEYAAKDVSFWSLARKLNAQNVPSPYGRKWVATFVPRILSNDTYVGDTRMGKQKVGKFARMDGDQVAESEHGARKERCEGLVQSNTHEGIIDRATWDLVQAKLKQTHESNPHRPRGEGGHSLTGILFCAHCGGTLHAHRVVVRKTDTKIVYRCRTYERYGGESGCAHYTINEADIRPLIINKLADEIDRRLLEPDSVQPPRPSQRKNNDEANARKEAELVRRIDLARDNILSVAKENKASLPGLLKSLRVLEVELEVLQDQMKREKEPVPRMEKELREWQQWFAAARTKLIPVEKSPEHGVVTEKGLLFTPETFRNMLRRYGCRVYCWWQKRGSLRRWEVEKVQILLGYRPLGKRRPSFPPENPSNSGPTTENPGEIGQKPLAPNDTNGSPFVSIGAKVLVVEVLWNEAFPATQDNTVLAIVREMASTGSTAQAIADHLNTKGVLTRVARLWNEATIINFSHRRGIRLSALLPAYTPKAVLAWADAFHERTGRWPHAGSGPIPEAPPRTWYAVNIAFSDGRLKSGGARSLAEFLIRERGARTRRSLPDLSHEGILVWADAHYQRVGRWPNANSGPIPEVQGESWGTVDYALRFGTRGLAGGSSLAQLLVAYRK